MCYLFLFGDDGHDHEYNHDDDNGAKNNMMMEHIQTHIFNARNFSLPIFNDHPPE